MRSRPLVASALFLVAAIAACSGSEDPPPSTAEPEQNAAEECKKGDSEPCSCEGGGTGTRACKSDRSWGACSCVAPAAKCGNGQCEKGETCGSCAQDCGACAVCTAAKACRLGASPPASFVPTPGLDVKLEALTKEQILARLVADAERGAPGLVTLSRALATEPPTDPKLLSLRRALSTNPTIVSALQRQVSRVEIARAIATRATIATTPTFRTMSGDAGAPDADAGLASCTEPPKLRLRIERVTVQNPDDDVAKDIIYCNVATQSPGGSENRITQKTPNLGKGGTHAFGQQGVFWGQKAAAAPNGDLTIQYDCFEEDASGGYEQFVQSVGEILADEAADRLPDGYGWVSTAIDLVARYAPALIALDGDDHLLSAQQVLPRADQLKLAAGASWSVRRSGDHNFGTWDWTLRVQAWGCVDNGTE